MTRYGREGLRPAASTWVSTLSATSTGGFPCRFPCPSVGDFVRFQQDDHAIVVAFMLIPDVHTYLRVVDLVRQYIDMVTGG